MADVMDGQWDVEVIWPGSERAITSRMEHSAIEITDGGVVKFWHEGAVVAAYGPGFWVSVGPRQPVPDGAQVYGRSR
jgi:hypothetical protein